MKAKISEGDAPSTMTNSPYKIPDSARSLRVIGCEMIPTNYGWVSGSDLESIDDSIFELMGKFGINRYTYTIKSDGVGGVVIITL